MAELRGPVRYRFRSDEHDVQVLLEGESQWVQQRVEELGLEGVGWTMPISTGVQASNTSGIEMPAEEERDPNSDAPMNKKPADMGPTPDPSRIPVVRRPIGKLNLAEELDLLGLKAPIRPDPIELMATLEEMDPPQPVSPSVQLGQGVLVL